MCTVMLAIKPEYAQKIFNGDKQFEFRRRVGQKVPTKIIIYVTSPYSCVMGEARVKKIIVDQPEKLWQRTKQFAGIEYRKFIEYFSGTMMAYAYSIEGVKKYRKKKSLSDYGLQIAPQSFVYLKD
ncbi:MAG: ASCH domain-containing protein [Phascolarctobacterium sp.]|nr:ASCH domain-containing protein [Candidatus Phascolarctobacterium caballi]